MTYGVGSRILALAIIPTLLVSLALSVYFVSHRQADLTRAAERNVERATQYLTIAASPFMQTQNRAAIRQLVQMTHDMFHGQLDVMIFDKNHQALAPSLFRKSYDGLVWSKKSLPDHISVQSLGDSLIAYAPIVDSTQPNSNNVLGYVSVRADLTGKKVILYETILTSFIIIAAIVILGSIFALQQSQRVTRPIIEMAKAVDKIRKGDFDTRVYTNATGELLILNEGINAMAESLKRAQDDMLKNVEQTTADLKQTLEHLEIKNIELTMAHQEAQKASRIKSEFLSKVSHEIRTPMNGVIGFCNLLLKTELTPKQREYLETIRRSANGLLHIINDILDFSKIESGKFKFEQVQFNIRESIDEVITLLAPTLTQEDKDIELVGIVDDGVPEVIVGDKLRINQVLINLVNNAIKFTEQGNVVIRVSVFSKKKSEVTLRIVVSDTGPGLTAEQKKLLFLSFTQIETGTTRRYGGTGLGLTICKSLVEGMGGKIDVDSRPGEGSDFWFTIKSPLVHDGSDKQPTINGHGRAIVCYEKSPPAQEFLRIVLTRYHFKPILLDDAEVFVRTIREWPYDTSLIGASDTPVLLVAAEPTDKIWRPLAEIEQQMHGLTALTIAVTRRPEITNEEHWPMPVKAVLPKPYTESALQKYLREILPDTTRKTPLKVAETPKPYMTPTAVASNQPVKALVVDDNPPNRKLLITMLEALGIQASEAASGKKAIHLCQQEHFNIIFMDIQMPEMDGVETTEKIRALANYRHVPIIAVTAHALPEERAMFEHSGFNECLIKPIEEQPLQEIVDRWVQLPILAISENHLPESLKKKFKGNEPLAREMLQMFYNELPTHITAIEGALGNNDLKSLRQRVHKLHGAVAYLMLDPIVQMANELETALKQNEQIDDDIRNQTQTLLAQLNQMRQR